MRRKEKKKEGEETLTCSTPSQTVPFKLRLTVLTHCLEPLRLLLGAKPLQLFDFHLLARRREPTYQSRGAPDGICLWFRLGLLLFSNCADLIKIPTEDRCIRHVFGGFGQLQQDNPGAYREETHDNGDD